MLCNLVLHQQVASLYSTASGSQCQVSCLATPRFDLNKVTCTLTCVKKLCVKKFFLREKRCMLVNQVGNSHEGFAGGVPSEILSSQVLKFPRKNESNGQGETQKKNCKRIESKILMEKYMLGERVGKGRFGTVRLATSLVDDRMCVIKVFTTESRDYIAEEKDAQVRCFILHSLHIFDFLDVFDNHIIDYMPELSWIDR